MRYLNLCECPCLNKFDYHLRSNTRIYSIASLANQRKRGHCLPDIAPWYFLSRATVVTRSTFARDCLALFCWTIHSASNLMKPYVPSSSQRKISLPDYVSVTWIVSFTGDHSICRCQQVKQGSVNCGRDSLTLLLILQFKLDCTKGSLQLHQEPSPMGIQHTGYCPTIYVYTDWVIKASSTHSHTPWPVCRDTFNTHPLQRDSTFVFDTRLREQRGLAVEAVCHTLDAVKSLLWKVDTLWLIVYTNTHDHI